MCIPVDSFSYLDVVDCIGVMGLYDGTDQIVELQPRDQGDGSTKGVTGVDGIAPAHVAKSDL